MGQCKKKNIIETDGPQVTIYTAHATCMPHNYKATNTRSEYVILIALPRQQWYANAPQCYVVRALSVLLYRRTLNFTFVFPCIVV